MKRRTPTPPPPPDAFTIACASAGYECVREYRFHPVRKWRFDYALPSERVAIEVEGGVWTKGRHITPKGFLADIDKYNTATAMGWRVFRVTPSSLLTDALHLISAVTSSSSATATLDASPSTSFSSCSSFTLSESRKSRRRRKQHRDPLDLFPDY